MIRITNLKRCHVDSYDDIYLIMRSISFLEKQNSSLLKRAVHLPALSPSWNLFKQYQAWKDAGVWDQNMFDNNYKPVFLNEIAANPDAETWLSKLAADDAAGRNIALLCVCADENLCHRLLIGEMLRQRGCNVILDRDTKRGVL